MDKNTIMASVNEFTRTSPKNFISADEAIQSSYSGMKIFESPIFAFGAVDDKLYDEYKSPDIIGSHFLAPLEWLPSAKTVISFFLPYTDSIKSSNKLDFHWPSDEWLHGRIEGQYFVRELSSYIEKLLTSAGCKSIAPALDPRYKTGTSENKFTSNWSERHTAFACGLGTFGLSKGIITEKGTCGRLGSVLTELDLPKSARNYTDVYEYCTMCGLCIPHCPVNAISFERGKLHKPCSDFLDSVYEKHNPRYGCGKCQVSIPCESEIPVK